MQKILFAAAIAIATLFSTSDAAAQPEPSIETKEIVKEATEALCNCDAMKEISKIKEEIEGLSGEEKTQKQGRMMVLISKIQPCLEPIEAKVEALDEVQKTLFRKEFEASIKKTCPDLIPKK